MAIGLDHIHIATEDNPPFLGVVLSLPGCCYDPLIGVDDADIAGGRNNPCGVIGLLQVRFNRDQACRWRDHPGRGFDHTWGGLPRTNLGTLVVLERYGSKQAQGSRIRSSPG